MIVLIQAVGPPCWIFGTKILIFSIAGLGMMILTGFTGLVSLGHAAFMLLGAYLLSLHSELVDADAVGLWALISGLITAVIVGANELSGGAPALRMTGIFLSIASLLFLKPVRGVP